MNNGVFPGLSVCPMSVYMCGGPVYDLPFVLSALSFAIDHVRVVRLPSFIPFPITRNEREKEENRIDDTKSAQRTTVKQRALAIV